MRLDKMNKEDLKDKLNYWINLFVKFESDVEKPFDLNQQENLAEFLTKRIKGE